MLGNRRDVMRCWLRRIFLLTALLVLPLLFFWANVARRNSENRVTDWLPAGSQELKEFKEFHGHFREGELLMASWEDAVLGDPRITRIVQRIADYHGMRIDGTQEPYFTRIVTSDDLFKSLINPPLELSHTEAKRRLRGWLLGRDKDTACLVAFISDAGSLHRADAIDAVARSIREETGLSDAQIYIAGPTIDSVAIDQITAASQQRLVPIFLGVCLVLLLVSLRNAAAAAGVFFIAATNDELGPALIYLTGGQMDSISLLIGSLVYVLTISAGVHLANYYRETLCTVPPKRAPWETVRKAAVPCALATVTTILGLISLAGSQMVPIRNFGIYASFSLGIGTLWLFAVFLVAAREFPIRNWQQKNHSDWLHILWQKIATLVERWHRLITLVGVAMMVVFATGLPWLKTSVTFHGMFTPNAKVIRDYNALEEQIGGLIPIEVILTIPSDGTTIVDQLLLVRETARQLEQVSGVDSVMAAPQFVPTMPAKTAGGARATMLRSSLQSILPRYADDLEASRFLKRLPNGDWLWRISLRVRAGAKLAYDDLLTAVREDVARVTSRHSEFGLQPITSIVTGGAPLAHKAQDQLLRDLIQSFFLAFVTIGITMMVLLRGVVRGLVSMVPNVFPCIVVFGVMAWGGYAVDMGSMMTASVAMGIAVDGTLHFMTWFHRGMREGQDRAAAVRGAYQHCATALTQTTVICGLGMLVFCASDFLPVAYFAKMLCFLLVVALVGDLVLLPAMLFGRLGRVFQPRGSQSP